MAEEIAGAHAAANKEIVYLTSAEYEDVLEERKKDVKFVYCIVFPSGPPKASVKDKCKPNMMKKAPKTQEEIDASREDIIRKINRAGFKTEMFRSTTKDEIICRIGATDDRILLEADIQDYKLELNPKSLQHVLETEQDMGENGKRLPIYLGFNEYTTADFKERNLDKLYRNLGVGFSHLNLKEARNVFKNETKTIESIVNPCMKQMTPYENIHVMYNDKWEEQIVSRNGVQIYRQFSDGTILRTADRIHLTQVALARENLGEVKGADLDFDKLIFDKELLGAFPIQFSKGAAQAKDLTAEHLYDIWRKPLMGVGPKTFLPWIMPLDDIRDYAGEKIAYYFAFLGFYSLWLLPAAVAGVIVFAIQQVALNDSEIQDANFLTKSAETFEKNVSEFGVTIFKGEFIGNSSKRFAVSEDGLTFLYTEAPTEMAILPFYALFISLWGTFLLEFWKRNQSRLAFRWGVSDYYRTAELRPEFEANYYAPSPITGLPVPYRSGFLFGLKLTTSLSLVGSSIGVVLAAFTATYIFKVFMSTGTSLDPVIAPQIALVVNAVAIIILAMAFKMMARKLTDWENHRTDIEYENMLIGKTFVFSFFNSYTTLMYFAFFRSGLDLPTGTGDTQTQYCIATLEGFDIDNEGGRYSDESLQKVDSCYGAVGYSLAIIFVSQILINNSMEVGIPLTKQIVKSFLENAKKAKKKVDAAAEQVGDSLTIKTGNEEKADEPEENTIQLRSPAEAQFRLQKYETPFDDYLEIALQFGYVTLFVAAFPMAPFLALLNNMVEVWVDATKVCLLSRRPSLAKAQDIGTWLYIFQLLSYISVFLNSALILFTSRNIIDISEDREDIRVWLFLAFIGTVVGIKYVADWFINDVPVDVTVQKERQDYYVRKVFRNEVDEEDEAPFSGNSGEDATNFALSDDAFDIEDEDPYMLDLLDTMKTHIKDKYPKVEDAFKNLDLDQNDVVDLNELRAALSDQEIGIGAHMTTYELKLIMKSLDKDEDGTISANEFTSFLKGSDV